MNSLKLVSDFDGIWTNQDDEAEYVSKYYLRKLKHISRKPEVEIAALLNEVRSEMNKTPWEYGWYYKGGLGCFYGEDPYGDNNAVFDFIEKRCSTDDDNDFTKALRNLRQDIIEAGHESPDKFATALFFEATTMYKNEGRLIPHPDGRIVLEKLLDLNVNVVIASNSKTEKIEYLFSKMGHAPTNNDSAERDIVHARGNSMKFSVDNTFTELPEHLAINDKYKVNLRRPSYYNLLSEERPDFVVGDVFSLDIALPLYLRMNDKSFSKLKVIQKMQEYTPAWIRDYLSRDEFKGIAFMIDDIKELPEVISKNLS